jgi:CheY-like chemotaxis protein
MPWHRGVTILLVEDNPDHAELTLRALREGNLLNELFWVKNGQEALDFLHRRGPYGNGASAPRPGLVLLDIKLPKVDGLEVLRRIKGDAELRSIPVVMLTTSEEDHEVTESYKTGANSFVSKPVRFSEFVEKIKALKLYWVVTNRLPDG